MSSLNSQQLHDVPRRSEYDPDHPSFARARRRTAETEFWFTPTPCQHKAGESAPGSVASTPAAIPERGLPCA